MLNLKFIKVAVWIIFHIKAGEYDSRYNMRSFISTFLKSLHQFTSF
jgi:hypothetical protein